MRTESHSRFRDFSQITQAENLKPSRVSQDRPRPRHEPVQASEPANLFNPGAQKKVIGISQENLYAKFLQHILRHAFDGRLRPDGHEDRRLDRPVGGLEPSPPGPPERRDELEGAHQAILEVP